MMMSSSREQLVRSLCGWLWCDMTTLVVPDVLLVDRCTHIRAPVADDDEQELPYLFPCLWAQIIAHIQDPVDYVNAARTCKLFMTLSMECYDHVIPVIHETCPAFTAVHHDLTMAYYDKYMVLYVRMLGSMCLLLC